MRTIIITDCETTGLDPATCKTIEVAACLYDVEHATPIEWCSWLMYAESNEAEAINKIPAALLATLPDGTRAWNRVAEMVELAEQRGPACYVAHRAEFDRSFYPRALASRLPWACSKFGIEWPRAGLGESCVGLALAHDVPVTGAHRALTDVSLLVRVFQRAAELGADVPTMLRRALRPRVRFAVAERSFDAARNALVKRHGFAWDAARREWMREMPREDASALPFAVIEVGA